MSEAGAAGHGPFLEIDADGVGWVTFADPERPVNVLTEAVMRRLQQVVAELEDRAQAEVVKAVVVRSGKPGTFIAGADVDAIAAIEDPRAGTEAARLGQRIFLAIDRLPVPTVAAIDGICVGGGLELAVACDYRLASDSDRTRLGFPEVQLGILPAWGGTSRLPRLLGFQNALDLLLTGRQIPASRARRIGLLTDVYPAPIFEREVRRFALARVRGERAPARPKPRVLQRLLDSTPPGRRIVLEAARRKVLGETGGHYPAPLRILEVVRESLGRPLERALEIEGAALGELIVSQTSKNLVHVFRLRERARKSLGVPAPVEAREVRRVGVVGAGVMGGGIAQVLAFNSIPCRLKDIGHEQVAGALAHARGLFDGVVKRKTLSRRDADQRMDLISGGLDYRGFSRVDLVVEAVVERLDVKRAVFAELEAGVRDDCVLATNTSSLPVTEIARDVRRPERVCGMHFFNPVHRMPLVEVVRAARTSDETVATVYALAKRLGKTPVVVADGPGFLVNRILSPYLNEAGHLLGEGLTVEAIDAAARAFGMPMGPLRLIDEIGIDVARHAGQTMHHALGDRLEPAPTLVALGNTNRLGRKGGRGFYLYQGGRQAGVDAEIYRDLGNAIRPAATRPTREEIEERLVLVMINEAARALEDGIVADPGDVDLGMIMGTGFPPFRGGLLRYADGLSVREVRLRLEDYEHKLGQRFRLAPLVVRLAEAGRGFYDTPAVGGAD